MKRRWKLIGAWFALLFLLNFVVFGGPGPYNPFLMHIVAGIYYMATPIELIATIGAVVVVLIMTRNGGAG